MAKTYVANYLFNYFGGDKVGDKLIRGATIDVAIRPYKNGKLIQFDPKTDPELFEIVDVSFDKSNIYKIKIHDGLEKNMCNRLGWDKITCEAYLIIRSVKEMEDRTCSFWQMKCHIGLVYIKKKLQPQKSMKKHNGFSEKHLMERKCRIMPPSHQNPNIPN